MNKIFSFIYLYQIFIIVTFIILAHQLKTRNLSVKLTVLLSGILIITITLLSFQHSHGAQKIGNPFENINDYEIQYQSDISSTASLDINHQNAIAAILRPQTQCHGLIAAYITHLCKRETLLIDIYSPKINGSSDKIVFEPNYCSIEDFNKRTYCIDDHSRTWIVIIKNKKLDQ